MPGFSPRTAAGSEEHKKFGPLPGLFVHQLALRPRQPGRPLPKKAQGAIGAINYNPMALGGYQSFPISEAIVLTDVLAQASYRGDRNFVL